MALAKCSTGASMDSSIQRMIHHDSTISNEVTHLYSESNTTCSEMFTQNVSLYFVSEIYFSSTSVTPANLQKYNSNVTGVPLRRINKTQKMNVINLESEF